MGRLADNSVVKIYGYTPTATAGTDVWVPGIAYPLQAAATQLEIVSASANDAAAGTGMRTALIQGLDANYNPISETITLNGATPVPTTGVYLRVNGLNGVTAGSGGTNAGVVTLRVVSAGATQAAITAGFSYAKNGLYTVPAGYGLLVIGLMFHVSGLDPTSYVVFGFSRTLSNGLFMTTQEYPIAVATTLQRMPYYGAVIPSGATLTTRVISAAGAACGAYTSIEGLLFPNALVA
jgi:hypothetical protein